MIKLEIAKKLKYYRGRAGLTIYEVGDKIGKSGKTVSAWENGRGQPDADMFLLLCDIYDVPSVNVFFSDNKEKTYFEELSVEEQKILQAYRKANLKERTAINALISEYMESEDLKEGREGTKNVG